MKLHREGTAIILVATVIFLLGLTGAWFLVGLYPPVFVAIAIGLTVMLGLVIQFFRVPTRRVSALPNQVVCPADGKVVVVEKVVENEFLKRECIQVSIFMSPLNVHINWHPVSGEVVYYRYHPGKYLVAWHPKSSTENERTTVVLKTEAGSEILVRQIAGAVARRIVCYAQEHTMVSQGDEMGFIKFGSRVDVFLPVDTAINVKIGQKVKGLETILAALPK